MSQAHPVSSGPVDPAYSAIGTYPDTYRRGFHASYRAEAARGPAPVLFLGDSITLLWNLPTFSFPGKAEWNSGFPGNAAWDANFSRLGSENFGVVADQTPNLLYRIEDGELAGKPKVAVVSIGINDLLLGGKGPPAVAAGVSDVIREIRRESPKTQILLLGLTPTARGPSFSALEGQVNDRISQIARQKNVTYLDPGRKFLRPDGTLIPGVLSESVHPGALGYQILAGQLIGPVKAALRR